MNLKLLLAEFLHQLVYIRNLDGFNVTMYLCSYFIIFSTHTLVSNSLELRIKLKIKTRIKFIYFKLFFLIYVEFQNVYVF